MTTVRVLLFASWSEALGARFVDVQLGEQATAADVVRAIAARAPAARLPTPAIAVNRQIVGAETPVTARDEIAVIPPVAGG